MINNTSHYRSESILQVSDTYIELPSGRKLLLDRHNTFTPSAEFWRLWNQYKMEIKRVGVYVKHENNRWRGHVRNDGDGFPCSQAELHVYWRTQAEELAQGDTCAPVVVEAEALSDSVPRPGCSCAVGYKVVAKICRNETFQLRLHCVECRSRTPRAVAWSKLGSDLVMRAIAYALQQRGSVKEM